MKEHSVEPAADAVRRWFAPIDIGALVTQAMAMPRLWAKRRQAQYAAIPLSDHLQRDIGFDRGAPEDILFRPHWRE